MNANPIRKTSHLVATITNPLGTYLPAEEGFLKLRADCYFPRKHLVVARRKLIETLEESAKESSWQRKSWEAYRVLLSIDNGVQLKTWDEKEAELEKEKEAEDMERKDTNINENDSNEDKSDSKTDLAKEPASALVLVEDQANKDSP